MNDTAISRYGKTIKDGKHHHPVWVKPEDIKGAICKHHQKCAVARAIMRQLSAPWVDVGATTVLIGISPDRGRRYLLSPSAKEQIRYFDTHSAAMAPCKLKLYAPPKKGETALGGRKGKRARSGKSGQRKRTATR